MKPSEYIELYGNEEIDVDKLTVKDNKEWFPEIGEEYWVALSYGNVLNFEYENNRGDKNCLDRKKPCKTREEAEFEDAKWVFLRFMEVEFKNNSGVIDREEYDNSYCVSYSHPDGEIGISHSNYLQVAMFNTTNNEWLERFIENYPKEIEMYYFGITKGEN